MFFFFNDTATTEIYTLSLHDALPISGGGWRAQEAGGRDQGRGAAHHGRRDRRVLPDCHRGGQLEPRSEEHTSELQSRLHLVCRLLLEKKKKINKHLAETQQSKRILTH